MASKGISIGMSLKELTFDKHRAAEGTRFMQELIAKRLPTEVWTKFVYQKVLIYKTLEGLGGAYCGLNSIHQLYRAVKLFDDFKELSNNQPYEFTESAIQYHWYITSLKDPAKIMAHIYVWHIEIGRAHV